MLTPVVHISLGSVSAVSSTVVRPAHDCPEGCSRPAVELSLSESDAAGEPATYEGLVRGRRTEEARAAESADEDRSPQAQNGAEQLSAEDLKQVQTLKSRDREVRAHEQAHKAVAGPFAGPIHYEYQTGPDQKRYAVGGHVPIDLSKVPGDPEATVRKMQTIRRAALAPADPSPADRQVAAQASQREAEARQDAREARAEEARSTEASGTGVEPGSSQPGRSEAPGVEETPRADGADRVASGASVERRLRAAIRRAYGTG